MKSTNTQATEGMRARAKREERQDYPMKTREIFLYVLVILFAVLNHLFTNSLFDAQINALTLCADVAALAAFVGLLVTLGEMTEQRQNHRKKAERRARANQINNNINQRLTELVKQDHTAHAFTFIRCEIARELSGTSFHRASEAIQRKAQEIAESLTPRQLQTIARTNWRAEPINYGDESATESRRINDEIKRQTQLEAIRTARA